VGARVDPKRIGIEHRQPAGCRLGDLGKRGQAARVLLDGKHMARALQKQPAREAAGTGADFEHVALRQVARLSRDLGGEVEIEQEILPQRLARREAMRGNDAGKRRQLVERAHPRARASVSASRSASISEAGLATPCPAMSSAVP